MLTIGETKGMHNEGKSGQCLICGDAVGVGEWYSCDYCGEEPFCDKCLAEHIFNCPATTHLIKEQIAEKEKEYLWP